MTSLGFWSRALLPAAVALAACSSPSDAPSPPGVNGGDGSAGVPSTEPAPSAAGGGGGGGNASAVGGAGGGEPQGSNAGMSLSGSGGAAGAGAGGAREDVAGMGGAVQSAGGAAGADGSGGDIGEYQPCPSSPCVVLPLGDSITYGYGSSDTSGAVEASPGGYRERLFALAVADNKRITFVGSSADGPATVSGKPFPRQHEGHPSYTIAGSMGITQFVDGGVVAKTKPHIVLLMIGTNDISKNLDLANAPQRLGTLLDKIFADAPSALIVVAQITPSQKEPANTDIRSYDAALPAVVAARVAKGKHAVLVDMNEPFVSTANWQKQLMRDSVHPNNAGYQIIAGVWYTAIRNYLH